MPKRLTDAYTSHRDKMAQAARNFVLKKSFSFYDADTNGDGMLSFDEWKAVLPLPVARKQTDAELKRWFDISDLDTDGLISKEEFFLTMLNVASKQSGSGLSAVFQRYDKNGDAALDALEFHCLCDDMGFGEIADNLSSQLTKDDEGRISHQVIASVMKVFSTAAPRNQKQPDQSTVSLAEVARTHQTSEIMKAFILALSLEANCPTKSDVDTVDTTGWSFEGKDPEVARYALSKLLRKHETSLAAVLRESDKNVQLRLPEFIHAFEQRLGFCGPKFVTYEIFDLIDVDQSGHVGMEELTAWLHGRITDVGKRRNAMLSLTLKDAVISPAPAPAGVSSSGAASPGSPKRAFKREESPSLFSVHWDEPSLRRHMKLLLRSKGLKAADLMRAWDNGDKDGRLSKDEFMLNMKVFVDDEDNWYTQMKAVAQQAFDKIDASKDKQISIVELQMWLGEVSAPSHMGRRGSIKTLEKIMDRQGSVRATSPNDKTPRSPTSPARSASPTSQSVRSSSPPPPLFAALQSPTKRRIVYRPRFYCRPKTPQSPDGKKPAPRLTKRFESRSPAWLHAELQQRAASARAGRTPPGWGPHFATPKPTKAGELYILDGQYYVAAPQIRPPPPVEHRDAPFSPTRSTSPPSVLLSPRSPKSRWPLPANSSPPPTGGNPLLSPPVTHAPRPHSAREARSPPRHRPFPPRPRSAGKMKAAAPVWRTAPEQLHSVPAYRWAASLSSPRAVIAAGLISTAHAQWTEKCLTRSSALRSVSPPPAS